MKHSKSLIKKRVSIFCLLALFSFPSISKEIDITERLQEADSIRSSNPKKLFSILEELEIDSEKFSLYQKNYFNYLKGYALSMQGKPEEAIEEFESVEESSTNFDLKFRATSALINMYAFSKNFLGGLKLIGVIQNNLDKVESVSHANTGLLSVAIFYNQMEDFVSAKKWAEKLDSETTELRIKCFAEQVIVDADVNLSPSKSLIKNIDKSIEVCTKANENLAIGFLIISKAKIYLKSLEIEKALNVIESKLEEIESLNYPALTITLHSLLTELYLKNNDQTHSEEFANKIIKNIASNEYPKVKALAYKILAEISELKKDYESSLKYQKEYTNADKIYLNDIRARQIATQQVKLETIEKENQIALLDKENDLLKTQAALGKEAAENDRLAMALLSLILVLLFLWAYKNRRMHIKLRKLAETDELTGISNRYHFSQLANAAISYSKKSGQPLCFILFDLDFFKKINDNFGHPVGDWALKQVVTAARTVCRNNDVIGRLGGEEFGILLPGCSIDKATTLAEACRVAIAAVNSKESGHVFRLTASFGVADAQICDYDFNKLFAAADSALYQSKDLGRNRVYRYHAEQLKLGII